MAVAGHKTWVIFDRYHIVSDGDLKKAAQKLNRLVSAPNGHNFRHNVRAATDEKPLSA
jgi:hypothetical protein